MSKNLYTMNAIDKLCNELIGNRGYDFIRLRDGVLLDGDFILVSPDEEHYSFVVREVALNEWSSAYTVRRTAKISKALWDEADKYEQEQEDVA